MNSSCGPLIIIPAYNEERAISDVISDLRSFNFNNILVVNDASTDNTEAVARDMNVCVITLPFSLRTGGAFKAGLEYAARNMPSSPVIQFDGDGQHQADQIPKLLLALNHETDIVIGSRFLGSKGYRSEKARRIGIKFFSIIVSFVTKKQISDVTSGFRAISPLGVSKLRYSYPSEYPDAGALVLAYKLGLSLREVSVDMKPRLTGRSYFRHLRSLLYPPRTIVSILAGALGKDSCNE